MGFADHDVRVLLAHASKPALDSLTFVAAGATLAGGLVHLLPPLAAIVSILWMGFQWYHSAPMKEWRARRREQAVARGRRPASVLRSFGVWCNAMLLALLSFTGEIAQALNTYLPSLAPYLPEHVQKWIGLAVVLLNIVNAVRRGRKPAEAREREDH
jgi:hypothetical protein